MRFFISISYNGRAFCGWQRQKNGPSIQEHLEHAFSVYLREKIEITGAGRTDTGVHAINYIAHFNSDNTALIAEEHITVYKINAILPSSIVLNKIFLVNNQSHARFDAQSRTYKYYVHLNKDPFSANYSYFFPYELNLVAMNKAAQLILGEKDFTSMAKVHSQTKTNICNVSKAIWQPGSPLHTSLSPSFVFTITANRFLRNMVRAIVGTLLEIGRDRQEPEWILSVLDKKNRSAAGNSVPSHALFLTDIQYPSDIFYPNNTNVK